VAFSARKPYAYGIIPSIHACLIVNLLDTTTPTFSLHPYLFPLVYSCLDHIPAIFLSIPMPARWICPHFHPIPKQTSKFPHFSPIE